MNATAQTKAKSGVPDVIAAGNAARAKIVRFEEELADREAEAERARVAFEREPTAQSHAAHAVALQKLKNAGAALEALREELRPALDACEQAERAALIEKLTAEAVADRPTFDAELEAIRRHIDLATHDLRVMLDALHSHVRVYNERADRLPRGSEMAHRISVERLLEKLNGDLTKNARPRRASGGSSSLLPAHADERLTPRVRPHSRVPPTVPARVGQLDRGLMGIATRRLQRQRYGDLAELSLTLSLIAHLHKRGFTTRESLRTAFVTAPHTLQLHPTELEAIRHALGLTQSGTPAA